MIGNRDQLVLCHTRRFVVPTRWGHLLIGNKTSSQVGGASSLPSVPTRWGHLLIGNRSCPSIAEIPIDVPTRWGHLLIGNVKTYFTSPILSTVTVPSRWGHLLTGNLCAFSGNKLRSVAGPHSLGTPIDWKPHGLGGDQKSPLASVPTRWGHLLTGN